MSYKKYEEGCQGCQPVVLDPATMQLLPIEHPMVQSLLSVWKHTTREEREAFHDFTCCNSRDPQVMRVVAGLKQRIEFAMKVAEQVRHN